MGIHGLGSVSIRGSEVQPAMYIAVDGNCAGEMSAYHGRRGV